jgi:hypothetical protein
MVDRDEALDVISEERSAKGEEDGKEAHEVVE